jgi:hypothetical protein
MGKVLSAEAIRLLESREPPQAGVFDWHSGNQPPKTSVCDCDGSGSASAGLAARNGNQAVVWAAGFPARETNSARFCEKQRKYRGGRIPLPVDLSKLGVYASCSRFTPVYTRFYVFFYQFYEG